MRLLTISLCLLLAGCVSTKNYSTLPEHTEKEKAYLDSANQRCDAGNAQGCLDAALFYEETDQKTALPYYIRGCNLGEEKACRFGGLVAKDLSLMDVSQV